LLEEELKRRGGEVVAVDVYRRVRAQPSEEELAALAAELEADAVQAITVTSVEVGEGLLALATPELHGALERIVWVVPGERVAAALRERGVKAPLLIAASAEDQALVAALKRWRAGESGAKSNESK
ncbi:MAG TPA: uroporphyrinogen-III synthase, partial [Steroidobacteraceae bacterium]|nr:uroporphyrinogen-III synthase [Steroidobacteraceae bacterium]